MDKKCVTDGCPQSAYLRISQLKMQTLISFSFFAFFSRPRSYVNWNVLFLQHCKSVVKFIILRLKMPQNFRIYSSLTRQALIIPEGNRVFRNACREREKPLSWTMIYSITIDWNYRALTNTCILVQNSGPMYQKFKTDRCSTVLLWWMSNRHR